MKLQRARRERRRRSGRDGRAGRREEQEVDRQQEPEAGGGGPPERDPPAANPFPDPPQEEEGVEAGGTRRWVREGLVTSVQATAIERLLGPGDPDAAALERLVDAGVITRSQAAAVERAQRVDGRRPPFGGSVTPGPPTPELNRQPPGVRIPRLPRIAVDARKLGVLVATLAFAGLVWAVLALLIDVFGTPRRPVGAALLDAVRVLAGLLVLVGGRRMYRGADNGKPLTLIGLVLYGLASALLSVRRLAEPSSILLALAWAVLYYVTATSRSRPAPRADGD
jgi:hypothetical protein